MLSFYGKRPWQTLCHRIFFDLILSVFVEVPSFFLQVFVCVRVTVGVKPAAAQCRARRWQFNIVTTAVRVLVALVEQRLLCIEQLNYEVLLGVCSQVCRYFFCQGVIRLLTEQISRTDTGRSAEAATRRELTRAIASLSIQSMRDSMLTWFCPPSTGWFRLIETGTGR